MTERLNFLHEVINGLKEQNLFNTLPVLESEQKNRVKMKGKEVLMLSSNNYLGFANNPRLRKAAVRAIEKWGFGTGAVRQIAGTMEIHMELERVLAKYKGTQDALVFTAGIAANRGTIQALMGEGDVIISDQLNHGSIIDGVRLTKAERKIYSHCNMQDLEKVLKESAGAKRRLVASDGVFSMDGDVAPLDQMAELCEKHDAILMIDDAHGDGVMGPGGRGTAHHFGVHKKLDIDMGTLSKAFGCLGGYIAGDTVMKDFLVNSARSFIFTTAHPPAVAAACIEAIKMVQDEPVHLKRLWENTKYFKQGLQELGFNTGRSVTPITPVIVGTSETAQKLSREMFEEDVFVKPIVYPLVAKDAARVRTIVTAQHTKEDLDFALEKFGKVGKKLSIVK